MSISIRPHQRGHFDALSTDLLYEIAEDGERSNGFKLLLSAHRIGEYNQ
jgi:hypothetical protein